MGHRGQWKYSVLSVLLFGSLITSAVVNPSAKVDFTEADDLNEEGNGAGFVSVYKNFPKIQVTVDTQKLKRVPQPETKSDESSSGSSGSSGSESVERPSVGVRTDITIEISEERAGNDTRPPVAGGDREVKKDRNGTGGKKDRGDGAPDDDNASIPVFKGMAGVSPAKPKPKPTPERAPPGGGPILTLGQRPPSTSFFYGSADDRNRISGEYDAWNGRSHPHTVTAIWTTERPYLRRAEHDFAGPGQHQQTYYKGYIPFNVGHHHHQHPQSTEHHHSGDWKPCYCSIYQPWAARAPTNPVLPPAPHSPPATVPPRSKVDNKVDVPSASYRQQQYRSIH
ncbi:uncharacterized protein LOC131207750 [Anopheles bellator]|uniref:uncharacterized protein LOC131207750 n=1 Tax=Anopheles bellator TaxID=139047 RepID=UPI0026496D2D|nr:uncharacterized protein LOC131207750 [Anopheles bellator]